MHRDDVLILEPGVNHITGVVGVLAAWIGLHVVVARYGPVTGRFSYRNSAKVSSSTINFAGSDRSRLKAP